LEEISKQVIVICVKVHYTYKGKGVRACVCVCVSLHLIKNHPYRNVRQWRYRPTCY
jgi:hypothetical protein